MVSLAGHAFACCWPSAGMQRPMFWLGVIVLVVAIAFTALGMALRRLHHGPGSVDRHVRDRGVRRLICGVARLVVYTEAACGCGKVRVGIAMNAVLQRRLFALAGAIVSFVAMALAYYAPATVMHRHIGAVAPILRDNFWLAVHVVTIMASYASAAIALILGNIALGYYLFGTYHQNQPPRPVPLSPDFIYTAIRITVLLLAAGTILGAFWADMAWGRFWAWDPKEVWALISLLVYILILHARYIGWSGDFGMALAAVLGATAVLFTWYGVNFLLGSGMHSYGSGAGGQWAVGGAVAIQWLFLAAAGTRYWIETGRREII